MKKLAFGLFALVLAYNTQAQDVTLSNSLGEFMGTWYMGDHPSRPAVLIIPGSGPVDRNGNAMGMNGNSLSILADSLQSKGITVLTTDKLTAASSKMNSSDSILYDDFVTLTKDWLQVMRDSGYSEITVLGHSQGALTALLVGNEESVSKVISLCGAGSRIIDVLKYQMSEQLPPNLVDGTIAGLDSLRSGFSPRSPNIYTASLFHEKNRPFLVNWDSHNPCDEIAKLGESVLIIQGENDFQVIESEYNRLIECNPKAAHTVIPGMGHMLKEAPKERLQALPYYNMPSLGLHPDLADTIVNFILAD